MRLADRRPVLVALCVIAFAGALLVGRPEGRAASPSVPPAATGTTAAAPADVAVEQVTVHVVGAVRRPGVYQVGAGSRAKDAIRAASGATRRADLAGLNLAAPVLDGAQLVVPERGAPRAAPVGVPPSPASPPAPVHLGAADVAALDALPGVGPATAARILAWRDEHGGFTSVDDLLEVPGIGPAKLEELRSLVVVP